MLAGAETLDTVLPAVASRARKLLRAEACHLYLLDPASEVLHLRASAPEGAETRAEPEPPQAPTTQAYLVARR